MLMLWNLVQQLQSIFPDDLFSFATRISILNNLCSTVQKLPFQMNKGYKLQLVSINYFADCLQKMLFWHPQLPLYLPFDIFHYFTAS